MNAENDSERTTISHRCRCGAIHIVEARRIELPEYVKCPRCGRLWKLLWWWQRTWVEDPEGDAPMGFCV